VKAALAVGLGGLLGSLARYKLGGVVLHHTAEWRFPLSTFTVNLLRGGGFTTFSAVGLETVYLLRRHEAWALANVVASVVAGVAAVWLGWKAVELFSR
jgi:fluoride exporter